MKEETLNLIRSKVKKMKKISEEENERNKRIKELEKDSKVEEYLRLRGIKVSEQKETLEIDEDVITGNLYSCYLYSIKDEDTNKIFVYLGTYKSSLEKDIIHSNDIRVSYDDAKAEYRIYQDIESTSSVIIPIKDSIEFERTHKIIYPKGYRTYGEYYKIQKEFFQTAVRENQEEACKLILRKYNSK